MLVYCGDIFMYLISYLFNKIYLFNIIYLRFICCVPFSIVLVVGSVVWDWQYITFNLSREMTTTAGTRQLSHTGCMDCVGGLSMSGDILGFELQTIHLR